MPEWTRPPSTGNRLVRSVIRLRQGTPLVAVLVLVIALSGLGRCLGLDEFTGPVFDEHYYVHDARVVLAGEVGPSGREAWLPGAERSVAHPELGKLVIAAGIRLLGDTPWGWRLPGALAGTLAVALTFPVARRLGLSPRVALAATVLTASDTLSMAMSRVATLDAQVALWTMVVLFAAAECARTGRQRWLAALGAASGLAVATKWSGLLAVLAAFLVIVLGPRLWPRPSPASRRRILGALTAVPALAAAVYVATYAQYFSAGHGVAGWLRLQEHMAAFGWHVQGSVSFASRPETWLFDVQPIWFRWFVNERGTVGLLALGNPVLFWSATAALVILAVRAVRTRSLGDGLVPLLVGTLYLPWLLTSRQTYLYYILPAVPFLAMAVAALLARPLEGDGGAAGPPAAAVPAWGWVLGTVVGAAAWPVVTLLQFVATSPAAALAAAIILAAATVALLSRRQARPHGPHWLQGRPGSALAWSLVGLASGVALAWLPFVLGLPVPYSYYDRLMLFTTWR